MRVNIDKLLLQMDLLREIIPSQKDNEAKALEDLYAMLRNMQSELAKKGSMILSKK